jgi:serine/threonine-protein kinase SRPK3
MAFTLPRYLLPRVASRFAPQSALRRQIPTITASPHTLRAPLPVTWIGSHISIRMAHSPTHVVIDPSQLVEEETVRASKLEYYYPVKIGEVFQDRYSVIGKLGYGSASTVWLYHDLQNNKGYVALKVYINRSKVHRELPIYTHINSMNSEHDGRLNLRKFLDSFEINGPNGKHICLVHEASGMCLEDFRAYLPDRVFSADLIRETFSDLLRALHFLREEAHVIHTGLL